MEKEKLDGQNSHWEKVFLRHEELFGKDPSKAAVEAAGLFNSEKSKSLLELGHGQGRDTLYFVDKGLIVKALDYSKIAVDAVQKKADNKGLKDKLKVLCHDVRHPLPIEDESLDACFSHMLFCMALTTAELVFLSSEVHRVLKPGGICVYTVRHTGDAHYEKGLHVGEDIYENGGFIVHFFNRELVKKLANGFEVMDIIEFEEGELPRKLFYVSMRKT